MTDSPDMDLLVKPLTSKFDLFGQALRQEIKAAKQYLESVCSQLLPTSMGSGVTAIVGTKIAQSIIRYGEQNKVHREDHFRMGVCRDV
jgi:hypothetical protein